MPKKEKTAEKPVEKKWYTIEVECLIPAIVKYRVLVDEGEFDKAALDSTKAVPMAPPKLQLAKMKRLSAKVYEYGTNMLKHKRNF
jgi:hypothetical protein